MTKPVEWRAFLKRFADAVGAEEWPGNAGASDERLSAAERRLKIALPPSYRAFLAASDGWRQASREVPVLRTVENIKWFRKEHADWVEAYAGAEQGESRPIPEREYFNYANGDSVNFDASHFGQTLCISELGDSAVLLLNPMVVWPDGEWEAWFFANWLPGATRYRCFADWMRQELAQLLDETFDHSTKVGELPTVYLDGPAKAKRRIRQREEVLDLAAVLERMKSKKNRERIKATQQLCRLGGTEAIGALLNALKTDCDRDVRCEAAEALGRLGAPEAVDALIAAIDDPRVNTTAIHALAGFKDEKSAQCLLKIVEENGMYGTSAVHPLAKRGDARAVGRLVKILMSKDPRDQNTSHIAGRLIADFEGAGFLALEPLVTHPDREIRMRSQWGIGDLAWGAKEKDVKIKARELLQRCLEAETDADLRRSLEIRIEISSKNKPKA
jgi:hypothetical protein